MNTYFKFRINKDGNVFTIRSPEGIVDIDVAMNALRLYEPYDLVSYEKVDENSPRGIFGGLFR